MRRRRRNPDFVPTFISTWKALSQYLFNNIELLELQLPSPSTSSASGVENLFAASA